MKLKNDILELEGNNQRCVVLADFSGIQTSLDTKFHIFVIVLLTNEKIEIPDSVKDLCVDVEAPVSMKSILDAPKRESKERRTKAEMNQEERPPPPNSAVRDFAKFKKRRKMELIPQKIENYKPCYTHFHFVVKRDVEVSQNSVYLQYCIEEYLVNTGLLKKFSEKVLLWTDGCFKHNKNYETQYWLASKMAAQLNISHHVLAPNEAHNQCDSSAAHAKVAIRKDIAKGAQFESVSNLAASYSRCTRYFLFEIDPENFPLSLEISHDEAFLVKCFDFYYETKKKRTLPECEHKKCSDKTTCKHTCCKKREAECVVVEAVDRDGIKEKYFLLEKGETIKISERAKEAMNLAKDNYKPSNKVINIAPKKNPERVRTVPERYRKDT